MELANLLAAGATGELPTGALALARAIGHDKVLAGDTFGLGVGKGWGVGSGGAVEAPELK